jgi:heme oxygenase (biliverdin-IX-beta and delta-forming)
VQPGVPEPTLAERARTLMHIGRLGMLATLARRQPGWPFGSLMPYALDDSGHPVFLISSMAVHTHNLKADARASLLVTQPGIAGDPLGAPRVTVMGQVFTAGDEVRRLYLERYEHARSWVDFDDFGFHRMEIRDVYYIGGFGVMGWIAAEDYARARPDPLADAAPSIINYMNSDRAGNLLDLARVFAGIHADEARMTSIDRLGFELRLKAGDRVRGTRVAFPREVLSVEESHSALAEMTGRAAAS